MSLPPEEAERPSWGLVAGDVIVPHCVVKTRLGGGHDFETYLAVDDRMLAPVVVKIVRPDMVENATVLQGLAREAHLTERLRHPLIVRSYYATLDGPRPSITLEMLPGEPLDVILTRERSLPLARTLDVGMGLSSALHYLRVSDVVHLDVRPANVMLGSVPRLIDFNLAFPAEQAARLTGQVGTRGYLAPEQCSPPETGVPSYATDVWGLGATLFKCIAGRRPFALGSWDPLEALEIQFPPLTASPRELPSTTPTRLADLVMACMSHDPAHRPAPADVFAELERIKSGDSEPSPSAGLVPTSRASSSAPSHDAFLRAVQAKNPTFGTGARRTKPAGKKPRKK